MAAAQQLSASDKAANYIITGYFGGYEGVLKLVEQSLLKSIEETPDLCTVDSITFIKQIKANFLKDQCGFLVRAAVNTFLSSFPHVEQKEINGVLPDLEKLKQNETFKSICKNDPAFNSALRNERIKIMLIDVIMDAKSVKDGPIGKKLIEAWRKMHPEKSFGGLRKSRRRRNAKRKTRRS
jgi:hypothetical protein